MSLLVFLSWAYPVNNGGALIGGSHINYVDYDREMFSNCKYGVEFLTALYLSALNMLIDSSFFPSFPFLQS